MEAEIQPTMSLKCMKLIKMAFTEYFFSASACNWLFQCMVFYDYSQIGAKWLKNIHVYINNDKPT